MTSVMQHYMYTFVLVPYTFFVQYLYEICAHIYNIKELIVLYLFS